jgi:hypothetical protein
MLPSRSRSRTSPATWATCATCATCALGALGAAGCGDDSCGPGNAPAQGLVAAIGMMSLEYGDLTSLTGNDCPDPAAPAGVISVSIEGRQTGESGLITFCIPRPDLLMEGDRTLGTSTSTADVRVIDLSGTTAGCTFALERTQAPAGAARATGVCGNGDAPDGFALSIDGTVALRRTCGATSETLVATLRGRVAVTRRN